MITEITTAAARRNSGLLLCGAVVLFGLAGCDAGLTGPAADGPRIVTSHLPAAMVHQAYTGDVRASGGGGEYEWTIAGGNLPPGLDVAVEALTGEAVNITGTPEDAGDYHFYLVVRDSEGKADTAELAIEVTPEPGAPLIESQRLPPALAGARYGVELSATGGDGEHYEWSVVDGGLPPGLELTAGGVFSGSPAVSGRYEVRVEVASGPATAQRALTLDVVPETDGYTITAFEVVDVMPSLRDNVAAAIERWEAALVGDLPTVTIPAGQDGLGESACGGFGSMVNGTSIEDIIILVNIDSIDGEGNVLGRAGPCAVRNGSLIPAVGILTLDEADLRAMAARSEELVTDLIQHEIGHILGFGTLWTHMDLVTGLDGDDPRYVGPNALSEYTGAGGSGSVPVENEGGEGTVGRHWREATFDQLLMTGFAEPAGVDMPLGRITIASFADMGYEVDLDAADVGSDVLGGLAFDGAEVHGSHGHDVAGVGPIQVVGGDGPRRFLNPH